MQSGTSSAAPARDSSRIDKLLALQTPASGPGRRNAAYLAYWLVYPFTLLECLVMGLLAALNYVVWRIVFLPAWHAAQTAQPPRGMVKQKIDSGNALAVMQTLERMARDTGAGLFWLSGTLLGLERIGRPLPHDTDMDAGLRIDDPHFADFIRAMWRSGHVIEMAPQFLSLKVRFQNPDLHMVPHGLIRYKSTVRNPDAPDDPPVKTDIFIHYDYCGGCMHGSRNSLWWNTPFDIVPREYAGRRFTVPTDTHLHLTENYGDYRIEVKAFENSIDCPNAMNVYSWKSLNYLLARQFVMLKLGRIARAGQLSRRIRATILKGAWPLCLRRRTVHLGSYVFSPSRSSEEEISGVRSR